MNKVKNKNSKQGRGFGIKALLCLGLALITLLSLCSCGSRIEASGENVLATFAGNGTKKGTLKVSGSKVEGCSSQVVYVGSQGQSSESLESESQGQSAETGAQELCYEMTQKDSGSVFCWYVTGKSQGSSQFRIVFVSEGEITAVLEGIITVDSSLKVSAENLAVYSYTNYEVRDDGTEVSNTDGSFKTVRIPDEGYSWVLGWYNQEVLSVKGPETVDDGYCQIEVTGIAEGEGELNLASRSAGRKIILIFTVTSENGELNLELTDSDSAEYSEKESGTQVSEDVNSRKEEYTNPDTGEKGTVTVEIIENLYVPSGANLKSNTNYNFSEEKDAQPDTVEMTMVFEDREIIYMVTKGIDLETYMELATSGLEIKEDKRFEAGGKTVNYLNYGTGFAAWEENGVMSAIFFTDGDHTADEDMALIKTFLEGSQQN